METRAKWAKAAGLLVATVLWLMGGVGRPVRWILPPDFEGWIQVEFNNPACPELQHESVYLEVRVSDSGNVCTPESLFSVWRYHRYVYEHPDGTHTVLNSNTWRGDLMVWPVSQTRTFIGSEEAFRQQQGTP